MVRIVSETILTSCANETYDERIQADKLPAWLALWPPMRAATVLRCRCLVSILALATVYPAQAKDFRALNFGEDCKLIHEYERTRESILLDHFDLSPVYQNALFGRTAVVVYNCSPDRKFRRKTNPRARTSR